MWQEFHFAFDTFGVLSLDDYLWIIDDALCHGFEFKVENHSLYFREQC